MPSTSPVVVAEVLALQCLVDRPAHPLGQATALPTSTRSLPDEGLRMYTYYAADAPTRNMQRFRKDSSRDRCKRNFWFDSQT